MIKEIEELMVHWGEQRRRHGLGAGIGSQMGSIMEWKGCAPRGTPGSRIISGGLGMDPVAHEIEVVVAALARGREEEQRLATMAKHRYLDELTQREQIRLAGLNEGAERTYRNWVNRLHRRVLIALADRASLRLTDESRSRR